MRPATSGMRGWAHGLMIALAIATSSTEVAAQTEGCPHVQLLSSKRENRALIRSFFKRASTRGLDDAMELVATDARWITPDGTPRKKSEMVSMLETLTQGLSTPFQFDTPDLTAEIDRVWAEIRLHAVLKTGRVYDNRYAFLFRISCGRITEVHEYSDTYRARTTFGQ